MHQPSGNLWRATTPAAAFDVDQALASVEAMKAVNPERLYVSHFGAVVETPNVDACLRPSLPGRRRSGPGLHPSTSPGGAAFADQTSRTTRAGG